MKQIIFLVVVVFAMSCNTQQKLDPNIQSLIEAGWPKENILIIKPGSHAIRHLSDNEYNRYVNAIKK